MPQTHKANEPSQDACSFRIIRTNKHKQVRLGNTAMSHKALLIHVCPCAACSLSLIYHMCFLLFFFSLGCGHYIMAMHRGSLFKNDKLWYGKKQAGVCL